MQRRHRLSISLHSSPSLLLLRPSMHIAYKYHSSPSPLLHTAHRHLNLSLRVTHDELHQGDQQTAAKQRHPGRRPFKGNLYAATTPHHLLPHHIIRNSHRLSARSTAYNRAGIHSPTNQCHRSPNQIVRLQEENIMLKAHWEQH